MDSSWFLLQFWSGVLYNLWSMYVAFFSADFQWLPFAFLLQYRCSALTCHRHPSASPELEDLEDCDVPLYNNMQFSRNYTIKSLHFSRLTSMPSREAEILSKSTGSMEVTAMLMCLSCTLLFSSKMMTGLNNWSR